MSSRTQVSRPQRHRRGWSLVQRLTLSLSAGALFVALVLGFLGADRAQQHQAAALVGADRDFAVAVAERASPLLERGDLMRLSVLATLTRDQMRGRVLVLDRTGRVVIDTALVLGERQLGLLAGSGPFQRTTARAGDEGAPDVPIRETLVPVRFGGEVIGEMRLQREVPAIEATFDFAWFALVLLCCLTLVVVAATLGHHWSARVRGATNALIRLSAGESGGVADELANGGDLRELGQALLEMERGLQDGLQNVAEGFIGMAQQIVDGLERQRLVPPGHGERTKNLAARLAERLQLLPADRRDLELACRLADLGKASVRAAILQKQGPLTDEEAESLRQHPVRGAEQLECMPPLRRAAKIVRHQQERYDGAGTPDGVRGDRIPLGSRVLAIASAFDWMTACAPKPMPWQEALRQLEKARGEVFDPWLLELFAEEIHKDPPVAASDRPVMIVPGGNVPWRTEANALDEHDDDDVDEIEVLSDDQQPGEAR